LFFSPLFFFSLSHPTLAAWQLNGQVKVDPSNPNPNPSSFHHHATGLQAKMMKKDQANSTLTPPFPPSPHCSPHSHRAADVGLQAEMKEKDQANSKLIAGLTDTVKQLTTTNTALTERLAQLELCVRPPPCLLPLPIPPSLPHPLLLLLLLLLHSARLPGST
jgi:hypothetical protein